MSFLHQQLMEQRVAELRRVNDSQRRAAKPPASRSRHGVRVSVGRALVRLGERLAPPAGTPVTR